MHLIVVCLLDGWENGGVQELRELPIASQREALLWRYGWEWGVQGPQLRRWRTPETNSVELIGPEPAMSVPQAGFSRHCVCVCNTWLSF